MKVTFLGTGTSMGVPVIACGCEVCCSSDARDKRLRSSVLIESDDKVIAIDSGPDFRQQMLRAEVKKLDAILFTHEHKDHVAGLDDVRAFNMKKGEGIDIYATYRVQEALKREFHYAFAANKYPGTPELKLNNVDTDCFSVGSLNIVPIDVWHHKLLVKAFRINDFTYITDANKIDATEIEKIKGSQVIVLNALRKEKHLSHFTLHEAIRLLEYLEPQKAYLTHISHLMGKHQDVSKELPPNIEIAYDGLKIEI